MTVTRLAGRAVVGPPPRGNAHTDTAPFPAKARGHRTCAAHRITWWLVVTHLVPGDPVAHQTGGGWPSMDPDAVGRSAPVRMTSRDSRSSTRATQWLFHGGLGYLGAVPPSCRSAT